MTLADNQKAYRTSLGRHSAAVITREELLNAKKKWIIETMNEAEGEDNSEEEEGMEEDEVDQALESSSQDDQHEPSPSRSQDHPQRPTISDPESEDDSEKEERRSEDEVDHAPDSSTQDDDLRPMQHEPSPRRSQDQDHPQRSTNSDAEASSSNEVEDWRTRWRGKTSFREDNFGDDVSGAQCVSTVDIERCIGVGMSAMKCTLTQDELEDEDVWDDDTWTDQVQDMSTDEVIAQWASGRSYSLQSEPWKIPDGFTWDNGRFVRKTSNEAIPSNEATPLNEATPSNKATPSNEITSSDEATSSNEATS